MYSRAVPSTTRRPSHSHANSITATPPHSSTDDSTSPWPKRSQDRCSDSSSGSCSRVLPAPSPPAVISIAPRKPSSAGPASRRGGELREQPRERASTPAGSARSRSGSASTQAVRLAANLASSARPALACGVDRCGRQRVQRPAGEHVDVLLDGGQRADRLDDLAQLAHLRVGEFGADRGRATAWPPPDRTCRRSSTASASSTVRLPERRSSPDGLPVTAGSPNTPSTSSRSWNATPRSVPTSWKIGLHVGPVGGGGHAQLQRTGDGVGGGLVGVDGHRRRHRSSRRWTRRRCRGTGRRAPRCGCRPRPAEPAAARRRAGRPSRRCRRPTPGRGRRAGSPPRCRTARPIRASCGRGASAAKSRCTVGSPRRVAESSMTSSCTSAHACSSSSAANSRSTSGSASRSATARQPQ